MARRLAASPVLNDAALYAIYVLWLHGYSLAAIARKIAKSTRQPVTSDRVWMVVRASPYRWRSAMPDGERQRHLDILGQDRIDGGAIEEWVFKIRPLDRRQTEQS